jgi:hypothetical protein
LLLFFLVTLAELTFLTAVRCTSPFFMTLLASSRRYHRQKDGAEKQLPPARKFRVFEREKITRSAIGDGSKKNVR